MRQQAAQDPPEVGNGPQSRSEFKLGYRPCGATRGATESHSSPENNPAGHATGSSLVDPPARGRSRRGAHRARSGDAGRRRGQSPPAAAQAANSTQHAAPCRQDRSSSSMRARSRPLAPDRADLDPSRPRGAPADVNLGGISTPHSPRTLGAAEAEGPQRGQRATFFRITTCVCRPVRRQSASDG